MESERVANIKVSLYQWQAIADLYEWEIETGKHLPTYVWRIVNVEMAGGIVDLETGEVSYPEGENDDRAFELQQHQHLSDMP